MSQYDIRIVSITPRQSCPNPFHMAVKKTELREKAKQYFQNMILAAHELSCPKPAGSLILRQDRKHGIVVSGWLANCADLLKNMGCL